MQLKLGPTEAYINLYRYYILMLPPKLPIRLGLAKEVEMWLVEKALYGLREFSKLRGDYRDIEISQMSFIVGYAEYEYHKLTCGWSAV